MYVNLTYIAPTPVYSNTWMLIPSRFTVYVQHVFCLVSGVRKILNQESVQTVYNGLQMDHFSWWTIILGWKLCVIVCRCGGLDNNKRFVCRCAELDNNDRFVYSCAELENNERFISYNSPIQDRQTLNM